MFSLKFGRPTRWTLSELLTVLAFVVLAAPAFAQTGRIQGKVTDEAGKAVEGAKITVSAVPDNGGQKWEATSDKSGNYIIGTLPKSGNYKVHAEKSGTGIDEAQAAVRLGNFTALNFTLSNKARVTEEQAAKNVAIKKFFEEGVAAANAGNHQAAVDAFTTAATQMPTCACEPANTVPDTDPPGARLALRLVTACGAVTRASRVEATRFGPWA